MRDLLFRIKRSPVLWLICHASCLGAGDYLRHANRTKLAFSIAQSLSYELGNQLDTALRDSCAFRVHCFH